MAMSLVFVIFVLNDLIKMLKTGLHIVPFNIYYYIYSFQLHNIQEIDFYVHFEDITCLGIPQYANTNNLGCILLKGRNNFRTKFWMWHHAVLKLTDSKL